MIFLNITDRLNYIIETVNVYCAVGARLLNIWCPSCALIARRSSSCCCLMIKTHDLVTWLRTSNKKQSHMKRKCRLTSYCALYEIRTLSVRLVLHMEMCRSISLTYWLLMKTCGQSVTVVERSTFLLRVVVPCILF